MLPGAEAGEFNLSVGEHHLRSPIVERYRVAVGVERDAAGDNNHADHTSRRALAIGSARADGERRSQRRDEAGGVQAVNHFET